MKVIKNQFSSIEQVTGKYLNPSTVSPDTSANEVSFDEILKNERTHHLDSELKFTKHASARLLDRNINLTNEQMERLETGTKQAGQKGIKESLVLVDQLAFIVNTKNNTVITAMDNKETESNVYTNIDGAVII